MKRTKGPGSSDGGECKLKRVPPKGPGQPAFDITLEMLLPLVNGGKTKAQMARELQVSESTIQRKLSENNISLRQMRSSNRKGSDDTRMNSAVRLRTGKRVHNTTDLDHVASQLAATSVTQSGQSTSKSTEMAAGPSCSPSEAHTRLQEKNPKSLRVTAAMFQGNLSKDITGEDYPDIDLQSDSTVDKGLVPDVSPPSTSLVLANCIQNAGDAKKAELVITLSGVRVEVGGGQVADCGVGGGYDVGQAVGFQAKAAFGENISDNTVSMGVLDESLYKIVQQKPFKKLNPHVLAWTDKLINDCPSFDSHTEMLEDSPETVKEKVKPAELEVEMRKKEACSNAAAPTTTPVGLSDDSKPVTLSIFSDDSGLQHRGVTHSGNSQLQEQGDPFLWQPEQDEDVTDTELAQLPLSFSEQETVGHVVWSDTVTDIREVEQVPEQPEFDQKDHRSGMTGPVSLVISHPLEQNDWQAVAGQSQGGNEAGEAFQRTQIASGLLGQEQDLCLDFTGLDEPNAMIEFDLMQGKGVLGIEGSPQIVGSGLVDQQMLSPGGVQTEAEGAGEAGQRVRQGLAWWEFCDQFLNYATENGVDESDRGNVPRSDMI